VKTVRFANPKYVGDPINAVKIFNEKEVDELIVVDIDATVNHQEPDYLMIQNLAMESRMPLCYGGGIKNEDHALKVFNLGIEKIAISSIAVEKPEIISRLAKNVGNQSVIVAMDVKKKNLTSRYEIWTHNAKKNTGKDPVEFAKRCEDEGAGEIVVNSIDRDGTMSGYDITIVDMIRNSVSLPITILGGAGSHKDIGELIRKHGIIGASAGSLFVFKGKYKAVLINYPNSHEKEQIFKEYFVHL